MRWRESFKADPRARPLADRHYNRQKVGSPQFMPPGRSLVLLTDAADALWGSSWPKAEYVRHAWPGAWICSVFRNESPQRASDLIRDAVAATRAAWGDPPPLGMVTFVDAEKVRHKRDPGRCFLRAGFRPVGKTGGGVARFSTRAGRHARAPRRAPAPKERDRLTTWADTRSSGKRAARGTGGVEWRPSWIFKGEETEDRIRELIAREEGPVLHVCAGASRIGDVRLDIVRTPAATIRADATAMPFRPGSFGVTVMDPPFNIPGPLKARLVHGCLNMTRKGGAFILHAPWFGALARLHLEDLGVRLDEGGRHWPRAPVMLSKWRVVRTPGRASSRWRRVPDARDAIRAGMKPGALGSVPMRRGAEP